MQLGTWDCSTRNGLVLEAEILSLNLQLLVHYLSYLLKTSTTIIKLEPWIRLTTSILSKTGMGAKIDLRSRTIVTGIPCPLPLVAVHTISPDHSPLQ